MKKINQVMPKFSSIFAALALFVATTTSSSTCWFMSYQPEEPDM